MVDMPNVPKKSTIALLVVMLFIFLTVSGIAFSLYLIYFGAHTLYVYALAAIFLILSVVSGFFNIFTAYSYYRSSFYDEHLAEISRSISPLSSFPTVAVAMPVYNEDAGTVKKNMLRLKSLDYPKGRLSLYLLDDSTIAETAKELRSFAAKNGIKYMHRNNRKGFKAGALNNLARHMSEDFLAIFDYDEYITNTNFLMDTLPYFQDKSLSYIQTRS